MIVWLASYPRSGNTYARLLLKQYFGFHVYSKYDDSLLADLVGRPPSPLSLAEMAASDRIFLVKTHDLPADEYPALYLVRDGRDALVSYAHYVLTYERKGLQNPSTAAFDQTLRDLVTSQDSFGGWGPNVLAWTRRGAPTAVIKFEQLTAASDPLPILKTGLDILVPESPAVVSAENPFTFGRLHDQMPEFFRGGRIGAWREEMPADLLEPFWDLHGEAMQAMDYSTAEQIAFYRQRAGGHRADLRQLRDQLQDKEKVIQLQEQLRLQAAELQSALKGMLAEKERAARALQDELLEKTVLLEASRAREDLLRAQAAAGLEARDDLLRGRAAELEAKESIIQRFRSSYFYWIVNGPFRWVPFLPSFAGAWKRFLHVFMPKLGILNQYPPRPLVLPDWYRRAPQHGSGRRPLSISIVTPTLNQGAFIERTVRSVLDQGYPALEYVVQDGGSTDGTLDALAAYRDRLARLESRPDRGQAHAVNLGFEHTTGEIMAYLNSDDELLPGALRHVADYFDRYPDVDVVYGQRVIIDEYDREIGRWVLPPHDDQILLWADYVPQETLFWRRRIWEKAGAALDEDCQFVLDWDLLLRFRAAGARFARLPRFLGAFRLQAESKTYLNLESASLAEMNRLRARIHGRQVDWREINRRIAPYLGRSLLYHNLYRLGILRY